MLSKLTLTIDEQVILRAKRYAQRKNRSVSRMVEDYLDTLSRQEEPAESGYAAEAVITDGIAGMFAAEYQGQEYRDLLDSALQERHLGGRP